MSQNKTAIISGESITVFLGGKSYTLKRGDENFDAAVAAVKAERWDDVPPLVARGFALEKWTERLEEGAFQFRDGLMHYNDAPLDHRLNKRMIQMAKEGKDPRNLMRFWEKLQENPSNRSVVQLFGFLEHCNIAIDQEGYILAYKGVRNDFKDKWTGKIDNSVGADVTWPRNRISDDPRAACAEGLHAGALDYAKDYAGTGRIVIVRIHPRDVVSVPYDSNAQKMRICAYKVIGNYGGDMGVTHDTAKDEATRDKITDTADRFASTLGSDQPKPKVKAAEAEPWLDFGKLSDEDLANQRVWDLRKYASRVLGIVGASKLKKDSTPDVPGLVDTIIEQRRKNTAGKV